MNKWLTSIIIFAGVATAAPAQAPLATPDKTQVDKIVELCMVDIVEYNKGDKTWIERQVSVLPVSQQKYVLNICYAWAQGFLLGVKNDQRRTI